MVERPLVVRGTPERTAGRPPVARITLFLPDLAGGGAERMMVQLASGFADLGIETDLVLGRAVGAYLDEVPSTVRLVDLRSPTTAAALVPLARHLRTRPPDIVLSTLHHASIAAELALRMARSGALHFVREANTPSHDARIHRSPKARAVAFAMRWVYRQAEGVVAVSEGVANDLHRNRGVPTSKLHTLYNPVVTPEVLALAAEEPAHDWFRAGATPVVLGVGSLQPRKGFHDLLEAFAIVRARRPLRLVVLGEGAARSTLEAQAEALGIREHVDFPGFERNPFAFMARAAVYVLSSEREGLPGALIQAMACGCPVVATDCPSGPAEVLEDGRHGELVPVGDVDSMARAIERTLQRPPRRAELRARASRFNAADVVAAHADVFARAIERRRDTAVSTGSDHDSPR